MKHEEPMDNFALGRLLLNLLGWISGVIVALSVGFALATSTLNLPVIPEVIQIVAGWLVLIITVIMVFLAVSLREQH